MKKVISFFVVAGVFSVLGALLDSWLGVSFSSSAVAITHKVFYMVNGSALAAVLVMKL